VAGGATWASLPFVVSGGVGTAEFTTNQTLSGWNMGIGAEYAFANNWTLGIEYRYTRYGAFNFDIPASTFQTIFVTPTVNAENVSTHDARLRLNYIFNWSPIVVRY
jgi:outer membrane immunogenic protein